MNLAPPIQWTKPSSCHRQSNQKAERLQTHRFVGLKTGQLPMWARDWIPIKASTLQRPPTVLCYTTSLHAVWYTYNNWKGPPQILLCWVSVYILLMHYLLFLVLSLIHGDSFFFTSCVATAWESCSFAIFNRRSQSHTRWILRPLKIFKLFLFTRLYHCLMAWNKLNICLVMFSLTWQF